MHNPEMNVSLMHFPKGALPAFPKQGKAKLQLLDAATLNTMNDFEIKVTASKTPKYFVERFCKHPFYDYSVHGLILDNALKALIATRIATHEGHNALRIVDMLGDTTAITECGSALAKLMSERQCEYVDFWQHGIDDALMKQAGFVAIDRDGDIICPNFFEPFLVKNGRIMCAVKSQSNHPLLICRADGDQDRPNMLIDREVEYHHG